MKCVYSVLPQIYWGYTAQALGKSAPLKPYYQGVYGEDTSVTIPIFKSWAIMNFVDLNFEVF